MSDRSVRGRIASKIEQLARILLAYQVVLDVRPLYSAASQCRDYSSAQRWGYSVSNLLFRANGNLKTIPANVEEISIELSISIEGFCEPEEFQDPLTRLEFNINIIGRQLALADNGEAIYKNASCSWHLDRHIGEEPPEYIHPLYHFQYGGNSLNIGINDHGDQLDISSTLVLDSPRIPHPPMDVLIGTDFILSNFISSSRLGFRREGEYINLILPVQEQLWKPYADVIAAYWQPNAHLLSWHPIQLWPQLL